MKKFRKIKKKYISLIVASLIMGTIFGVNAVDILAINTPVELEVVEVEPQINEEIKIEEKITYSVVDDIPEYVEIKDEVAVEEVVEEVVKPLTIADGKTIEEKIKIACDIYGVDYDIAMAIARLETGHFKSNAFRNKNNVGGMMWKGELMYFDTLDEGVDRYVRNLHKNYFAMGLNTPEKMNKKYCPDDGAWARKVRSLMREYE